MDVYALGSVSCVMTLVRTAIVWQVSIFGGVALVYKLSANIIREVGLSITPTAAVMVFHDKMNGEKGDINGVGHLRSCFLCLSTVS
ncbi:hypothetical protein V6N13_132538 [Hibiscus sabdariffa]|uniref:Uncharacterized protein n=1 Tax=Hibiscus sabdariffa TaxID=183260 RepID=A0ABR2PVM1_9ROSI